MLGERTAEEIKMTLGSAFPLPQEPEAEIRGRDMVSGLPRTVVGLQRRGPAGARGAAARDRRRGPHHPRPDPARAGRRHHGPRHRAHRRRRAAARPRRAAPPRDRDAGARRRGPAAARSRWAPASASRSSRPSSRCSSRSRGGEASALEMRRPRPGQRPRGAVARCCCCWPAFTVITLDARGGSTTPRSTRCAPRSATVLGPVEDGDRDRRTPPFAAVPRLLPHHRRRCATTSPGSRRENSRLRGELADQRRWTATGPPSSTGCSRTVARAPATRWSPPGSSRWARPQSFSPHRDHRRRHHAPGVRPDMTVLNNDGLVGRVVRADRSTATVLLLVDQRLGRRRPARLEHGDRLPARPRRGRRHAAASTSTWSTPSVDRREGRRAWSPGAARTARRTSPASRSAGSTSVYSTPAQQSTQRGDQAVRRLHLPRPRRRRRRPGTRRATAP